MARPIPTDAASISILGSIERMLAHQTVIQDKIGASLGVIETQITTSNQFLQNLSLSQDKMVLSLGNIETHMASTNMRMLNTIKELIATADKSWVGVIKDRAISLYRWAKKVKRYKSESQFRSDNVNTLHSIEAELRTLNNKGKKTRKEKSKDKKGFVGNASDVIASSMTGFAKFITSLTKFGKSAKVLGKYTDVLFSTVEKIYAMSDKFETTGKALGTFGKNVLIFGMTMALATPFLIAAIPGMYVTKFVIELLIKLFTDSMDPKKLKSIKEGADGLADVGKELLLFGTYMALTSIVMIPAMVGVLLTFTVIWMFSKLFTDVITPKDGRQIERGTDSIKDAAINLLIFGGMMALLSIVILPALIGALFAFALIGILSFILSAIPEKEMNAGTRALIFSTLAIVALAGAIFLVKDWIDLETIMNVGIMVGGMALVFGLAGLLKSYIMGGALAMVVASIPIVVLAYSMKMWKDAGVELADVGTLLALVLGLGVEMALAGAGAILIIPGAFAMIFASIAIIAMSYAIGAFKEVSWTDKDTDTLKYTITGVLGALRGDSPGGISGAVGSVFSTMMSLMSAGALIFGSVAIWLMSGALKEFKSVNWTNEDTDILKGTIEGVLSALRGDSPGGLSGVGGKILDTMMALMSAGALIFGSVAIWLMSESLKKFKEVGWTDADNDVLGNTISGVLNVLGSPGGNSMSPGSSILNTILALMNSGVLFIASGAIWLFSLSLKNFKEVGWTDADNTLLGNTISGVLTALGNPTGGATTAGGGILQTILALMGAGTIFITAGAIWLFSAALKQFKDVKWEKKDNTALTTALQGVNNALATADLKSISSIWPGKTPFDIIKDMSDSIEVFGKGLQSFKAASWTENDTTILTSAISKILNVFSEENSITDDKLDMFGLFTGYIEDLSDYVSEIDQMAESFERIADSMLSIKDSINTTELDKLTKYNDLIHNLSVVMEKSQESSVDQFVDGVGNAVGGAFEKFGNLLSGGKAETPAESNVKQLVESNDPIDISLLVAAMNKMIEELSGTKAILLSGIPVKIEGNEFG